MMPALPRTPADPDPVGDASRNVAAAENQPTELARHAATRYTNWDWRVVPIPFCSKNPGRKGWEQLRLTVDELADYFPGGPQNIGVLLGEPSDWTVDIDLDHPRCVELADQFLPPTGASFGRPGKPRSHRLYRVTGPVATKKFPSKSAGMLVELRSTGTQTVFPPSVHESGETIAWDQQDPQPAEIDPQELLACVQRLADAVKVELGEKAPAKKSSTKSARNHAAVEVLTHDSSNGTANSKNQFLAGGRNDALTSLAGKMRFWGADLPEIETRLLQENQQRCVPPLDDQEVRGIARSVARYPVGAACLEPANAEDASGLVPLGQRDPETFRLVLSQRRTLPTAEAYVRQHHQHPDGQTLVSHAGTLLAWKDNRYQEVEDGAIRGQLQPWLHRAVRYTLNKRTDELELTDFESNPTSVNAALETIRAYTHLPATTVSPGWLSAGADDPPPREVLPCRSYLLHLPTGRRIPATPRFFTHSALEFDPNFAAADPVAWLEFLDQLFGPDTESLELLQEWFGYCLTGDTSQQKMLLTVGPKRGGKGTIGRVLTRVVGAGNVCGPTTSSLAGPFGLQPLLGKSLAIVSDARFHGENITPVIERLLCISGEDTLTVDRKHLTSVTMKLPTRFMFLTNELPKLKDASGALAGRFLILRLTESFYGREDPGLTDRLFQELPGILNWAIAGWRRLKARGHFHMPSAVQDTVQDIEHLSSPVTEFVREQCVVGSEYRVDIDQLFEAWRSWCAADRRECTGNRQTFGRDLAAAVPGIQTRRGTANVRFYQGLSLREGHS